MMSIEDRIKSIAERDKFKNYSFVCDDMKGIDRALSLSDLPAITEVLTEEGSFSFSKGLCKDKEKLIFAFIDKVDMDADGEDNKAVTSKMKALAVSFISEIMKDSFFEVINCEDIKYYPMYKEMADNLTGISVYLEIKERVGTCV